MEVKFPVKLFLVCFSVFFFLSSTQVQAISVTLSWLPNTESDLSHYNLYRDTQANTMVFYKMIPKSDTLFTDTEVSGGKTYYYKLTAVDYYGNESEPSNEVSTRIDGITDLGNTDHTPHKFMLKQNYPNPFNPSTTIEFSLAQGGQVSLSVFDMLGREIRRLVDGNYEKGRYTITWDGRDNVGGSVASGVYVYRLKSGNLIESRRLVLGR